MLLVVTDQELIIILSRSIYNGLSVDLSTFFRPSSDLASDPNPVFEI